MPQPALLVPDERNLPTQVAPPAVGGEPDSPPSRSADIRRLDPELLSEHVGSLYRAAYGLCGSPEDAEDLVQETFERVLRRPRFVRRNRDLAYLLRVLRNTWIGWVRSRRLATTTLEDSDMDARSSGDPVVAQAVDAGAVYDALKTLTPPLREAVVAVDVVGLSYREAARALGTKEGTIMSRLHRARTRIAAQVTVDDWSPAGAAAGAGD